METALLTLVQVPLMGVPVGPALLGLTVLHMLAAVVAVQMSVDGVIHLLMGAGVHLGAGAVALAVISAADAAVVFTIAGMDPVVGLMA